MRSDCATIISSSTPRKIPLRESAPDDGLLLLVFLQFLGPVFATAQACSHDRRFSGHEDRLVKAISKCFADIYAAFPHIHLVFGDGNGHRKAAKP
jgi:hypothetical protein